LKKEVDDQWLYALNTRTGQYGIVPTVFLDVKVPLTPTPSRISMPTAFTGQQPKRPEPGSMPICVALFDYNTGVPGDLQFRVGERIQVSEKVDAEWLRGRTQTSAGYGIFPVNFVQLENQSPGKKSTVTTPTTMPSYGVTALYDYNSGNPDDLIFKAGDVIEVVEKIGAEWLRGRLHGRMGLVPVTFVGESAGSPRSTAIAPSGSSLGSSLVGRMMVAQYDYNSAARDDLNFAKGDKIQITEEIDAEWLRGRLQLDMANQRSMPSGIFPRSYVA